jgi:hypothetical protein
MMSPVHIARLVAAGRIGFGVALLAAPSRVTGPWLGEDAGRAGTQVVSRGLGARDLALGVGALVTPRSQLRPWVVAAIAADAADAASTLAAGSSLPRRGRVLVGAVASAGVVLGALSLAGLPPKPQGS